MLQDRHTIRIMEHSFDNSGGALQVNKTTIYNICSDIKNIVMLAVHISNYYR